jgi:hypothetical protein
MPVTATTTAPAVDEDPDATYTEDDQGNWHPVRGVTAEVLARVAAGPRRRRTAARTRACSCGTPGCGWVARHTAAPAS